MIKFAFSIYILVLSIGALFALFTFIFDVIKWHNMERKENIINSSDLYYGKGGVIRGRTGDNGTGRTGYDNNDNGTGTGNDNNDIYNDNAGSKCDIQFSLSE